MYCNHNFLETTQRMSPFFGFFGSDLTLPAPSSKVRVSDCVFLKQAGVLMSLSGVQLLALVWFHIDFLPTSISLYESNFF